jgi:hypothetical protein
MRWHGRCNIGVMHKNIGFAAFALPLFSVMISTATAHAEARPTAFSAGLGMGHESNTPPFGNYVDGRDLSLLNAFSLRLRWSGGLTIEPTVARASTTDPEINVRTALRYPVLQRGRLDLDVIASVGYWQYDPGIRPISDLSFGAGFGVSYWIAPHLAASISATTAFYTRQKRYSINVEGQTASTTPYERRNVTLGFNPQPNAMLHLFF